MMLNLFRDAKIYMIGGGSSRVAVLLSWRRFLESLGWQRLSRLVLIKLQRDYGVYIHAQAQVSPDVVFRHPTGVVIGAGVRIEKGVVIYQQVTIGGARIGDMDAGRYPVIEAGVTVFAGAKILGDVKIGANSVIGANAVVLKNVPADHVAVGVPARNFPKNHPLPEGIE